MRETEGALFNTDACLSVTSDVMEQLKHRARRSPTRRYRLCLHRTPADPMQDMIVVHCRDNYSRPHRHPRAAMSYVILEGRMTVFFFDERGKAVSATEMGPHGSGLACALRIEAGVWYTPVCRTGTVMFHETLAGRNPGGKATEYADWAPAENDADGIIAFRKRLHTVLRSLRAGLPPGPHRST